MSIKTQHSNQPSLYYITFTCKNWLPLFELTNSYDLVYNWFDYLQKDVAIKTTAYIIMPNHVHCILFFPSDDFNLSKIVANGKHFMAYKLIQRLQEQKRNDLLLQLKEGLSDKKIGKGQMHQAFQTSFDAKPIYHRQFLLQKINYIHLNPVRGKWKLAAQWEDYEHSSAKFYVKNKIDGFTPVHYEELY